MVVVVVKEVEVPPPPSQAPFAMFSPPVCRPLVAIRWNCLANPLYGKHCVRYLEKTHTHTQLKETLLSVCEVLSKLSFF